MMKKTFPILSLSTLKMGRWACVSTLLLGCQGGVLIDAHVTGRPDDAPNLLVTAQLNETAADGSGQALAQQGDHFHVQIPGDSSGRVTLHVSAQDASGCELAAGDGAVELHGPGSYPIEVALTPQQGCTLKVELVGPGAGQVTSIPAGLDCGTHCTYRFSRNQVVGLVSQTQDLLGGWFADGGEGSCAGRLSCAITIGSGTTRVRANFIHPSSCTASGWCTEGDLPAGSSQNTLYALWGSGRDDVWAVGDAGTILHGDGILWSSVPSGTTSPLRAVWGSSTVDVWAVGSAGTIRHWDGKAWTDKSVPTAAWLTGIWGSTRTDVWAVGDAGTILHWDGTAWTAVASGTTHSLRSVWGSGPQDVWAVGDAGTIVRWGGAIWAPIPAATGATSATGSLYGVWGASANNIWLVGEGSTIFHYTGAETLGQLPVSGITVLHAVWGASALQTWAVGDGGVIVQWNGSTWTRQSDLPSSTLLAGVWGSGLQDVWTVGPGQTILRYRP